MSSERSSSAVRNLRTIFENKASERSSLDSATSALANDKENDRPKSKIRTSFIPVELQQSMAVNGTTMVDGAKDGSTENTRDAEDNSTQLLSTDTVDAPPMNPDKPTMGAEQETSAMASADLTDAATVSGTALSSESDNLPARPDKTATASPVASASSKSSNRPSSVGTKIAPRLSSISKSSRSGQQPVVKDTAHGLRSSVSATSRPPRASLTAPTAASVARAAKTERSDVYHPPPKPKPREPTRPMEISARLTAPTAASRARQAGATPAEKSSHSSLPGIRSPSSRSAGRPSLGPVARGDGADSFLERMTRPTAASQHRIHEKIEPSSPSKPRSLPRRVRNESKSAEPSNFGGDATSEADQTLLEEPVAQQQGDAMLPSSEAHIDQQEAPTESSAEPSEELSTTVEEKASVPTKPSKTVASPVEQVIEDPVLEESPVNADSTADEVSTTEVKDDNLTSSVSVEPAAPAETPAEPVFTEQDNTAEVNEDETTAPEAARDNTDEGSDDPKDIPSTTAEKETSEDR